MTEKNNSDAKRSIVTQEVFDKAVSKLNAQGITPSIRNLIEAIGYGSHKHVGMLLRAYNRKVAEAGFSSPIPQQFKDNIISVCDKLYASLLQSVNIDRVKLQDEYDRMHKEVLEKYHMVESLLITSEIDNDEKRDRIKELEAQVKKQNAEILKLQERNAELTLKLQEKMEKDRNAWQQEMRNLLDHMLKAQEQNRA